MHVCYDPQNDIFFEVDKLTDLKDYDGICLDRSIFSNMWQQSRELISNGKRSITLYVHGGGKRFRERFREELKTKVGKYQKMIEEVHSCYGKSMSYH
jgi:hypothetical protein